MNNNKSKYKPLIDSIDALIVELNTLRDNVLNDNIQAANNCSGSIIDRFEELKNKVIEFSSKRSEDSQSPHLIEMNIYDAIPLLNEMLNVSGFCKEILKKVGTWISTKSRRLEFYSIKPGFSNTDVKLMNQGMQDVADFCIAHILRLPSEYNDKDIYAQYAIQVLKDLRSVISMPYLRENYTNIARKTFTHKVNLTVGVMVNPAISPRKTL